MDKIREISHSLSLQMTLNDTAHTRTCLRVVTNEHKHTDSQQQQQQRQQPRDVSDCLQSLLDCLSDFQAHRLSFSAKLATVNFETRIRMRDIAITMSRMLGPYFNTQYNIRRIRILM